ncbi:alkaline phosphatase family protein [Pyxidicoccus caerfyrddinensis]|uniref:alkaline phosphatase family protein n=1 Tax=Pyxidicoccus caerfyrddinensis TaxID=2709663 RepID=UPI0013DB39EC|nr:alkaline phosphatase family protein [Pyxidicoccus caerfyrddinensis]
MADIVLFSDRGFRGDSITLGIGSTRFVDAATFNDTTLSVRVPAGWCVKLYEHANENGGYGRSVELMADCPDLGALGLGQAISYVTVFSAERDAFVFVRGRMEGGNFVPGHWERRRASGAAPSQGAPVVSPPLPPPTQPESHSTNVVRDHRGDGVRWVPAPETGPGRGGGVVHDHRKSRVKHLFVLVLENRSFDHMLGFSGITGTDASSGQPTAIDGLSGNESNTYAGVSQSPVRGAPDVARHDPGHNFDAVLEQLCGQGATYAAGQPYPEPNNSGFYSRHARGHADDPAGAMHCFTPDQVPVITALAKEFVVCDHWFSSMPGPTEPNRWFVHAATAADFDNSPSKDEYAESLLNHWGGFSFPNGSIYQLLDKHDVKWRIYACDEFPNVAELDGVSRTWDVDDFDDFLHDIASPDYDAAYTFIEPSYDALLGDFRDGNSQHPLGSARAGERLIKRVYEALRRSPIWESSMLLVTYDEHGGFYDHVPPPKARPTGAKGRAFGFTFDRLGVRVPAIIVSPLIPRNLVDHRVYEHSSIASTLIDLFNLSPLTVRSSSSSGFKHLATLPEPRQDAPMTLPDPDGGALMRMKEVRIADAVAAHPERLLSDDPNGTRAATLRSALAQHMEVTPEAEHPAILARVKALRTQGEALQYLKDVAAIVEDARERAGVQPSPRVRRRAGLPPRHPRGWDVLRRNRPVPLR